MQNVSHEIEFHLYQYENESLGGTFTYDYFDTRTLFVKEKKFGKNTAYLTTFIACQA